MKTISAILFVLLAAFCGLAVEPPIGGVFAMAWNKVLTNETVDYCIWESTNGAVRWKQIGGPQRETTFTWTNRNVTPLTFYRVTQIPWMPSGSQDVRQETEIGLLHWAPSQTTPATNAENYVRMAAADVPTGRPLKLSSDLLTFDDWLTLRVLDASGTNELTNVTVRIEHRTNPHKPKLFVSRPASTNAPLP